VDSSIARKEAIRKFKERKPIRGVYAVRCTATGRVWVGAFTNLEAIRNRLWFSLGQRAHRNQALQQEWDAHGEQTFEYEIVEKLDDDLSPIGVSDALKEKKNYWINRLGAQAL
jgi:hypothetical protein